MKRMILVVVGISLIAAAVCPAGTDLDLVVANMGRQSGAVNPAVGLSPRLSVSPPRRTVMAGDVLTFSAAGSTNPITWFLVEKPSGCEAGALNSTSLLYRAGVTSSCVDVIQAWDGYNRFGRAYANVISAEEVARAGKAIIVAGRRSASDTLWPTTDYLADLGYNTLRYRGFSKANLRYLSPEPAQDVDGNGLQDDIAGASTLANAADSFTNWAARADTAKLFVYLVDHGQDVDGAGQFYLSSTEVLTAAQLDAWLDALQDRYHTDVTVLIDCCNSGSFVDELSYTGTARRVVIAACGANEPACFEAGGLVSFSDAFFSGILMGLDVAQSYALASAAMSDIYQQAILSDPAGAAAGMYLGATFVAGKDIPLIGGVLGNQLLTGNTRAVLWADNVVAAYTIDRVWCVVVPPGHTPDPNNPVTDLPQLDLAYDATAGRYQAAYDGFSVEGVYKVIYYASDIWGSVSLPQVSYVTQAGFKERVVLVAGGSAGAPQWESINRMGNDAYHTFRERWFAPEAIDYFSAQPGQDLDGDGTNEVDALPTRSALEAAITNGVGRVDRLTVYLIGDSTGGAFQINSNETVSAADLSSWLGSYQASNGQACVVLDFAGSGAFLPTLRPPADRQRLVVASAKAGQNACRADGGVVSFTRFFLSDLFSGLSVGQAFDRSDTAERKGARWATYYATGNAQVPQMDANGNGVANEPADKMLAASWYIGTAFMTGADVPYIGAAMPDGVVPIGGTATVWAADVTDADGVSSLWCLITPPGYDGTGELAQTNLAWNAASGRYEADVGPLTNWGPYVLTFLAMDLKGEISTPVQTILTVADAYEPDDAPPTATGFAIGEVQRHNFHATNDEDWVKFYLVTNFVYKVDTFQVGTNVDTALDVYRQMPDGTLSNLVSVNDSGLGEWEGESVTLPRAEGMHYVRVSYANADGWGPESQYDLQVDFVSMGGVGTLLAVATDKLHPSQSPPGATAIVDGTLSKPFSGATSVEFKSLSTGWHTVQVTAPAGYVPEEDPKQAGQPANPGSVLYGNPKSVQVKSSSPAVAVFSFVPVVRADGCVRDRWTGERLSGAPIVFTARNGVIAGQLYYGYPQGATWASSWQSGPNGAFPANVWLPAVDWDLWVGCAGYGGGAVRVPAIQNAAYGAVTNVGTLWLTPTDANGNGIADAWENGHLIWGLYDLGQDTDGDGVPDRFEYLCGTDPRDPASFLHVGGCLRAGADGAQVRWPVAAGRTYALDARDSLSSGAWQRVWGPVEAAPGQTWMDATDPGLPGLSNRFYRVELVPPEP